MSAREDHAAGALVASAREHLRAGRLDAADAALREALARAPRDPEVAHARGMLAAHAGEPDDAVAHLRRAVELAPARVEWIGELGLAHQQAGDWAEAETCYRRVLDAEPASLPALNNLGIVLETRGRLDDAAGCYRRLVELRPDLPEAHANLGNLLQEIDDLDGAVARYRRAIELRPDYALAWENLGSAHMWAGRMDEALAAIRRAARIRHDHRRAPDGPARVASHRIVHDAEQARYLEERGLLPEDLRDWLAALETVAGEIRRAGSPPPEIELDADWARRVAPSFNRIAHVAEAQTLPGGALDPALDLEALQDRYCGSDPPIVVVDDLLAPEALARLRAFCLESTVWKETYPRGYLGAYLERGFACPLLLQLQDELRRSLPRVFGAHRLRKAWGFKYDSRLEGIDLHADFAAVNVNFWLTPDAANEDPEHGGLVLWDKPPPPDWGPRRYQARDKTETRRYLEAQGARPVTVPYRANRAVIFDSLLFHRTDDLRFAPGYENRRVNVTLLYGRGRAAR